MYYKNARTHELDDYLGDIYNDIVDSEAFIARQLEDLVLQHVPLLQEVTAVSAQLDW